MNFKTKIRDYNGGWKCLYSLDSKRSPIGASESELVEAIGHTAEFANIYNIFVTTSMSTLPPVTRRLYKTQAIDIVDRGIASAEDVDTVAKLNVLVSGCLCWHLWNTWISWDSI